MQTETRLFRQHPGLPAPASCALPALLALFVLCALPPFSQGAARQSEASVDFRSHILPIISAKCFSCHGPDEEARKAKLRLDQREDAIKDRDGLRVIAPGDLAASELVRRITTEDPDDLMPPPKEGHPLTTAEIDLLKKWIEAGAPYETHWAFVKPARPELPEIQRTAWPRNEIDHFILQKLEENSLEPAPSADRHTLARRLSLDLIGLPLSPEEVRAFVEDETPEAYERLVDRLLASPAYGERWARVWLDLARYADSAGYGSDPLRPNIWPWRDWVISALNRNLPFDQFTLEQIAGDLLPDPSHDQLIATAFHRNTMTNTEGGTDDEEFRVAAVKDRANTTAQVWMGLTLGCAQCHTHKYDPITQREYYQFYALFNQTEDNDQPNESPTLPLPTPSQAEQMDRLKAKIESLEKVRQETTPQFLAELADWEKAQAEGVDWLPLEPFELRSYSGASLSVLSDHSVLAGGHHAETDIYTLRALPAPSPVTALRLEALPDDSLPKQGPGRAPDSGQFVLNEIQVSVRARDAEPPRVRFVRVELPGTLRVLSLAEVQIWSNGENLARFGRAAQSSTAENAEAERAIDGKTQGDFEAGSTTLTMAEDNPWWELDLGEAYRVDEIELWNRTDRGLGTRLNDFKIVALNSKLEKVWEQSVGPAPSPVVFFRLPEEKSLKLKNASANFSGKDFNVGKAIDGSTDGKSGWSAGDQAGMAHAAAFEIDGPALSSASSELLITLTQKHGTNQTLGRFRLSATSAPLPVRELPDDLRSILAAAPDERTDAQKKKLADYFRDFAPSLAQVNADLKKARQELDEIKPVALPVLRELASDKQRKTHLFNKGNFLDPGDEVSPGVLQAFHEFPDEAPANRLGLAQWLVSPENPLTARVAVNRLWARLFGAGLVETEEDFGTQSALPTHPELLDWLATEFMNTDWDMKAMLKLMVLSATYQQSSRVTPELLEKDSRNTLYARASRRRLEAETVRDQALALSGLLSRKIGGPSVYPRQPEGLWRAAFNGQRTWPTSQGADQYRRGLYTFWRRTVPYPSMATFDAPSRETCTVRRIHTNTPLQAFVTLNDPVFVEAAQALGRRIYAEGGATTADRIRYALTLCVGRPPEPDQIQALLELYEKELAHYQTHPEQAKKLATDPLGALPEPLTAPEAAAWTAVANVLLNLDAVLMKS